jgi:putative (di)nucleoside polyphosphate hydrolase
MGSDCPEMCITMNQQPYRPNVAAIILSPEYPKKKRIFLAERIDIGTTVWQFPQGGIDKGESARKALFRELKEEIGTDKIEIIAEYPEWIAYEYPEDVVKKMRPYAGQTQRYYLVKLKKDAKINLDTKHPEFSNYKFVKPKDILDEVSHFKKPVYKKAIQYFKKEGYL